MRRGVLAPVLTVAALLMVLAFASRIRSTYAPSVPADIFHNAVINDASCTTCHTPGRQAPLKLSHAAVTDCLNCHHMKNRE